MPYYLDLCVRGCLFRGRAGNSRHPHLPAGIYQIWLEHIWDEPALSWYAWLSYRVRISPWNRSGELDNFRGNWSDTALEVLTRSARSDSPRKTRPEQIPAKWAAAAAAHGGGGGERRKGREACDLLGPDQARPDLGRTVLSELLLRVGLCFCHELFWDNNLEGDQLWDFRVSKLLADTITEAVGRNHHLKGKESVAEIKSCKLPQFKETRFVLFWEIVQLTEERCTEMERSDELALTSAEQFWNLSNDHISTEAIYAKATPLKKVDDVGATTALLQKYIYYTVHQQRENEKKDEAIDRH
ncbi:hypothetical protein F511_15759 [Dorcoceras hygrometricum]|uniref:Uncharacterized protein n=1 Tax=Dorcoceras hygrometricum TaxID=472368 RepID=A0A2Z7BRI4_9LAMI|nr:hypothetical protein F511_15759 [Dorcoceras hygrometricum]